MSGSLSELALVLSGGGARGAYQVGFLRHLARRYPDLPAPILTGASAGAVNAIHLASRPGRFSDRVEDLTRLWQSLSVDQVFRVDALSLLPRSLRWIVQLGLLGGRRHIPQGRGLVDTSPLRSFLRGALRTEDGTLPGIVQNLREGRLRAIALSTTHYGSGSTVTFCEGREVDAWERPQRHSVLTRLTVDHVMASAALPLFFPAVEISGQWFGDGSIRLHSPLAPAVHLGAGKIIAVSTRSTSPPVARGPLEPAAYPPPAQILGVLFNSVFLDLLDQDALRLERINRLLAATMRPPVEALRPVDLLVLRPSIELGAIASAYEPRLPGLFRFLTRRLGTREARGRDLLSMLMFQRDFLTRIIELGEADADGRADEIAKFVES
jgi:NTE family protein